ncbi:MAG: DUF6702 family protein [Pseudomonadota bacterium]
MIRALIVALCLVGLPNGLGNAHEQRLATTEVLFNARSGFVEVAHRFSLHDAEHAVALAEGERPELLSDPVARAAFASYIGSRFDLVGASGEALAFAVLGTEIDGGYIWIYQEAPMPSSTTGFSVRHGALHEIWPDQRTFVTIRQGDQSASLVFEDDVTLPVLF